MEKSKNGKAAPGADTQNMPKPLTLDQVKEWTKRDLVSAIMLLDAIYRDQATVDMLADILYGRYMNAKHKEELEKQTELGI